jgi:hypothetical protein
MISFSSFPVHESGNLSSYQKHYRDQDGDEDVEMDFDDLEDDLGGGSKLTSPGEAITSAQDFMR